jgi:AraC-like DNA-binding protein
MQASERLSKDDAIRALVRSGLLAEGETANPHSALQAVAPQIREYAGPEGERGATGWKQPPGTAADATLSLPTVAVIEPSGSPRDGLWRRDCAGRIRDYLQRFGPAEGVAFPGEEGRVGLLFSWVSKGDVESLRDGLRERLSRPVNIGVGLPCGELADVRQSYRQALLALEHKFYKGAGQIVYYHEVGRYRRLDEYPAAMERELYERIRGRDGKGAIEAAVGEFYDRLLADGPLDRSGIDEATLRLLIGCEKRALAEAGGESAYTGYPGVGLLRIVQMETLEEVKAFVRDRLEELLKPLWPDPVRQPVVIKKTIEYMERDFGRATLGSTAKRVYMTPAYLSALFKSNTGKTFIEQLTDIRIEKAKLMLRSTPLKNYEVAEKVGYKDSRYFSQIFKKKVGLSPSEYRKSAAR